MKRGYFDRSVSQAIKGIALILMFVHHFFTFPEWYPQGIDFPLLLPFVGKLRNPTRICVPVFAFLTGYFFFLGPDKSYRRSLGKIRDLLISYWMVYLPLLLLALGLGCWTPSWQDGLAGALGLSSRVMPFCWYVYFFCAVMLLLPLVSRFSTGKLWADGLLLLFLPLTAFSAARELLPDSTHFVAVASALREFYPCVVTGFLFAKYDLFETVLEPLGEAVSSHWGKTLLWLVLAGAACLGRAIWPWARLAQASILSCWLDILLNMDVLYAPVFLYAVRNLLEGRRGTKAVGILGTIGEESMRMWFLHCLFFNCCKEYTQPLLYWPRLASLVLIWGLALCYGGARLWRLPTDFLLGKIRKCCRTDKG